jgi:hypothetical protein
MVAIGIIFELPIFILALVRIGALSSQTLRRNHRVGYGAMAILAVALPGVDPITTLFEMLPLTLLFEASIWLSFLFERCLHNPPARNQHKLIRSAQRPPRLLLTIRDMARVDDGPEMDLTMPAKTVVAGF